MVASPLPVRIHPDLGHPDHLPCRARRAPL